MRSMEENEKTQQLILYYHGSSISREELIEKLEDCCDPDIPCSSIEQQDDFLFCTNYSPLFGEEGYYHYNISSNYDIVEIYQKVQQALEEYGTNMFQNFLEQSIAVIVYDDNQKQSFAGVTLAKDGVELYLGRVNNTEVMISNSLEIVELYCDYVASMPDYSYYMNGYIFYLADDFSIPVNDFLQVEDKDVFLKETSANTQKKLNQKVGTLPAIDVAYSKMKEYVIGQDEAIKQVLMALYNNLELSRKNFTRSEIIAAKENVLFVGPAGVGKTEIVRQLENLLNILVVEVDIQQYSPTGYAGKDVMEILENIYIHSNQNLEVAQRSILFVDEIDKKLFRDSQDAFPLATLNQLLKIIEGGRYNLSNGVEMDTKNLTVVCAGAFQSLFTTVSNKNMIGFENHTQEEQIPLEKMLANYGLPDEFLSRMKRIVQLNMLSKEDQKRYLLESKLSILNIKSKILAERGIEIHYHPSKEIFVTSMVDAFEKNGIQELGLRGLSAYASSFFDEFAWNIYNGDHVSAIELSIEQIEEVMLTRYKK